MNECFNTKIVMKLHDGGLKLLISKKGWLVAIALFMFFLTKGLMWLIIPYLIAKGLL